MKKLHVWRRSNVKPGRVFCENCGVDQSPATEAAACRPTRL